MTLDMSTLEILRWPLDICRH